MLRCEEAALGGGTAITVRDLFYNVPARRKFLRTEPTELAHIASLVTHYSLAHPDKTFLLTSGATELLHVTPVADTAGTRLSGLRQPGRWTTWWRSASARKRSFCGRRTFRRPKRLPNIAREPDEPPTRRFRLSGFFSRPQVQKNNRNSIYIFVNGRLIRDRLLLHAISSAYHNLMPASCLSFRAAVSGMRCRRGGRERASFQDRGALPARIVRARFRARHAARAADGEPAGALVLARRAQGPRTRRNRRRSLPYSEFSQMLENEAPPMLSTRRNARCGAGR